MSTSRVAVRRAPGSILAIFAQLARTFLHTLLRSIRKKAAVGFFLPLSKVRYFSCTWSSWSAQINRGEFLVSKYGYVVYITCMALHRFFPWIFHLPPFFLGLSPKLTPMYIVLQSFSSVKMVKLSFDSRLAKKSGLACYSYITLYPCPSPSSVINLHPHFYL